MKSSAIRPVVGAVVGSAVSSGTATNEEERHQYETKVNKHAFITSSLNLMSPLMKVSLLLLIIFAANNLCEAMESDSGAIAGNGLPLMTKRSRSQHQYLPECADEKSVCGYVQLNSQGISSQPICRCRGPVQCPMMWNPMDGRTVSHGNDQYKYCNRAPALKRCTEEDLVYTTYLATSMTTFETIMNTNHIHCLCPAHHLFVRNSTKFHDLEDGTSIIGTSFQCKPPPECGLTDACLAVTESAHSSFITRNCICPFGSFCPNDVRLASERVDLNRGSYYIMNCI